MDVDKFNGRKLCTGLDLVRLWTLAVGSDIRIAPISAVAELLVYLQKVHLGKSVKCLVTLYQWRSQ